MKATTLILVAVLLAACGSMRRKEPPPKPFVGTKWVMQLEVPIQGGPQPWVQFGDGLMDGYGGCNRIAAKYVQDTVGSRFIAIGRIDRGTKACEQRAQLVERRVLETLQSVSSYRIIADGMTMSGSGGSLRFISDPAYTEEELKKF
ncbi:MAG TPA: META domain-containing protein [Usitatibacter sp.]|nr:META domain-containing protein [Usitatibacter sp.]